MHLNHRITLLGSALVLALLSGCATQQAPLYYWGDYQQQVYERLKAEGKSSQEQIIALEAMQQQARAQNLPLPPGFQAHLAMLYAEIGKPDQVQQQLESEKTQFPESGAFMDFLLAKLKGGKK